MTGVVMIANGDTLNLIRSPIYFYLVITSARTIRRGHPIVAGACIVFVYTASGIAAEYI